MITFLRQKNVSVYAAEIQDSKEKCKETDNKNLKVFAYQQKTIPSSHVFLFVN